MKACLVAAAVFALTTGVTGCSTTVSVLNDAAAVTAKIASNSQTACADLHGVGVVIGTAVGQVAKANPNNAALQRVAANIAAGRSPANTDCLLFANLAGLVRATVSSGATTAAAVSNN